MINQERRELLRKRKNNYNRKVSGNYRKRKNQERRENSKNHYRKRNNQERKEKKNKINKINIRRCLRRIQRIIIEIRCLRSCIITEEEEIKWLVTSYV